MSKSPHTPNSANKKIFRFFSRQNLRKDSIKENHVPLPPPPSSHTHPHPRTPTRSFTSPRSQINQKIPPRLRVDVWSNSPYTAILEKFPDPPSATPLRGPLPSSRSWHNLRENEVQDAPSITRFRSQKEPKPRPKGFLVEPEAYQMYLRNNSTTTTLDTYSSTHSKSQTAVPFPKESPFVNLSPISSSDEETAQLVDLDDFPWYLVEMTNTSTKRIHGLSPVSLRRFEKDLDNQFLQV